MLFSSNLFLYMFLPIVLGAYLACACAGRLTGLGRLQNMWLIVAGLFFYAWGATWFCGVLILTILVDYAAGLAIAGAMPWGRAPIGPLSAFDERSWRQRAALTASIAGNVGLLAFFKYFNFGVGSYNGLMRAIGLESLAWHTALRVALPLGISFFTFQSMSYTIDVYLGRIAAARNLLDFMTYRTLFPVMVSGPIVRYESIAGELASRRVTLDDFAPGVRRFILGLGKKILIANVLAVPADAIFGLPPGQLTTPLAWLGAVCYTLQIYFDFSGYSDMAIGLGRMLGFHFPENFNYPYVSRSISEFWRRWHMSLSSWFRDYVFMPLNMAWRDWLRRGTAAALMVTFLLTGVWHGANWTFVAWGVYHGALIVGETLIGLDRKKGWQGRIGPLRNVYTMLAVVIGWVFFRAAGFEQALGFLRAMAGFGTGDPAVCYPALFLDGETIAALIAALVFSMPVYPAAREWLDRRLIGREGFAAHAAETLYGLGQTALHIGILLVACVKLSATTHNPFIYFRF
ncbi:MAG: MBOAT family protein [Candidatus Sumerlaeia bacterium]